MENILDPLVQQVILESSAILVENQRSDNADASINADAIADDEVIEVNSRDSNNVSSSDESDDENEKANEEHCPGPVSASASAVEFTAFRDFTVSWPSHSAQVSAHFRSETRPPGTSNVEQLIKDYDLIHQSFIQKLRASLAISNENGKADQNLQNDADLPKSSMDVEESDVEFDSPVPKRKRKSIPIEVTPPESPEDLQIMAVIGHCNSASPTSANTIKENPFLNQIVLTELFKCSVAKDLKTFRLVNKRWLEIATSSLLNRRLCKILLTPSKIITDLNSCIETTLKSSRKFPCCTLFLSLNLSMSKPGFSKFFKLFGSHIKELIVESPNRSKKPINVFRNLLIKQLPKVEHLEMRPIFIRPATNDNSLPESWRLFSNQDHDQNQNQILENVAPSVSESVAFSLPLIKTLRFDSVNYTAIFQDLLDASVNLEKIKNFKIQQTLPVCTANKIQAVKEFQFPFAEKHESMLQRFAAAGPKLEYLDLFRFKTAQAAGVGLSINQAVYLTMILTSSSETLKRLRLPCLGFLNEVNFPCLPKVKELCIFDLYDQVVANHGDFVKLMFPPWLCVNQTFPNLEKVVLEFKNFVAFTIDDYIPTIHYGVNEELTEINCLELAGKFDRTALDSLSKKFPNVTTLSIRNTGDYLMDHSNLWYFPWPKLETLELHGVVLKGSQISSSSSSGQESSTFNGGQRCSLESFFTGIPEVMCARLKTMNIAGHEKHLNQCCLNILQVQPCISSLKDLKLLKIFLDHPRNFKWHMSAADRSNQLGNPEVSQILTNYAFDVMQKLKSVKFFFDHNASNSSDIAFALSQLTLGSRDLVMFSHEPAVLPESDSDFFKACNTPVVGHHLFSDTESSSSSESDSDEIIELVYL